MAINEITIGKLKVSSDNYSINEAGRIIIELLQNKNIIKYLKQIE
jgi:hypothetical protein